MSSVSGRKTCKIDEDLGSKVEEEGRIVGSSLDKMMRANEGDTFSEWRVGMVNYFSCKSLWKIEELFLEDEKTLLTLNSSFTVFSFFDSEGSPHDSMDGTVGTLRK